MLKFKLSNSLGLNYRFIVVLLIFIIFNIIGLHYEPIFQKNADQHIKAVGILEELKTSIYKQRNLIAYLQIEYLKKNHHEDKGIMKLVHENNGSMHKLVNEIQNFNASGEFGIPSIGDIYFDRAWRVDEGLTHFSKLINSYLGSITKMSHANINERDIFYYEIEKHGENILNSLIPIKQELLKTREQYLKYMSLNDELFRVITFLFALSIYIYLYRPWKKQIDSNRKESQRLKELLSESELKGNLFSWELNYVTKELRQSKHLTSIFNLSDDNEYSYLYDELSCFYSDDREKFLLAVEKCVSKEENLEITVQVTAKNKRFYWLHYSAKKRLEKDIVWISGTVQDITDLKVAQKRFDDLFNQIGMPLVIFGEGKIHDFNNSAKQFFGLESKEGYKLLHPAIMFPLYQEDGRSSLEKLSKSIEKMGSGGSISDTWSFHTVDYGVTSAKTLMFDINFNDTTLHLMIISQFRDDIELERRLVDAYRKAQYSRRSKVEYIAQNSMILQEFMDSLNIIRNRISSREEYSDIERESDSNLLEGIHRKIQDNCSKYIRRPLEEAYSFIIFDFKKMIETLEGRWSTISNGKHKVQVRLHFDTSFFWGDILKIKGLLIAVVENALQFSENGNIHLNLYHDRSKYNKEQVRVEVTSDDKSWPGNDWIDLMAHEGATFEGEQITPKRALELVDFLDGEFEFHHFSPEGNDGGVIKFSFSIKSVHRGIIKRKNEVYFMTNSEEYFVPYHETAISSSEVWNYFGGDWDLIESAIRDFIEYYPQVIADIHNGLSLKDGTLIHDAASELYGVLTHFPFFASIDRVVLIQKYGEYLRFNEAEKELNTLIQELFDFAHILEEFLPSAKEDFA